ncbi:hypothetical protein [Chitinimonas sp.]|uniref:hypothetical protein n=1 Tax=Chitinimonas sp. TaxID=1934313 RepID=UPI0035AEC567
MNASSQPPIAQFTPCALAELARHECPELPWLSDVLLSCGAGAWDSPAYLRFVSAHNANQPGSEWRFETNVVLVHEIWGVLVLDILKSNRLGGIEFIDRIED